MSDLISKKELLRQIDIDSEGQPGWYGDTWQFIDTIKNMPSAEPKQGEWIEDDYEIKCSVCGKREDEFIYGWGEWETNGITRFCPNCGARMKGADDE